MFETDREILIRIDARLNQFEAKLDKVLTVTTAAERLLAAYTSGGRGKLLSVLAAARHQK